jgi:hypothetical protein
MKFAKAFLIVLAVLAIIGGALWHVFLKDQVGFGKVATAYAAKQICSCRFVSEREMASCQNDFTQDISALKLSETEDSVTASALGLISATATYEPRLGCVLQK